MKMATGLAGALMMGLVIHAAEGTPIVRAVLQAKTGATVASAQADGTGRVRFTNVPPGTYRLVLTNAAGRTVSVADLDGDGVDDIIIEGVKPGASPMAAGTAMDGVSKDAAKTPSGRGSGKASMSDLSVMKTSPQATHTVTSPRDAASGLATGRRMHKPYVCLVDWDGTVKGGFQSEAIVQAETMRLPDNAGGRCSIKVVVDEQPGTIEILSYSWGASNQKQNKTGHVTLMK